MNDRRFNFEDSLEAGFHEQRWFAAMSAVKALQLECNVLRQVRDLADAEWQVAQARLQTVEAMCNVFGEDLARCGADPAAASAVFSETMSAA